MRVPSFTRWLLALLLLGGAAGLRAEVPFDLLAATPVGSWQHQESVTTDAAGNETRTRIETALLAEERRDGVDYVWVQTEVQPLRRAADGSHEPAGERTVLQTLLERRVLAAGRFGGLDKLRGLGHEVVFQVGAEQPTRVRGAGQIAATVATLAGANTTPELTALGSERITTPAGAFATERLRSEFASAGSLLGQSMDVRVTGTVWLSPDVPFGVVKSDSTERVNGSASATRSELVAWGRDGAASKITGEPRPLELPPELQGILGGWF